MTGINIQDEAQNSAELKVLGCFTSANGAKAISKALNYVPNGSFFLNPHRGKLYDLILELYQEGSPLSLSSLGIKLGDQLQSLPSASWAEVMDATDEAEEASDHIEWYAKKVADQHFHRQAQKKLHSLSEDVQRGSIDLDQVEEGILSLKELKAHHQNQNKNIGIVLNELLQKQIDNHQNPGIKGAKTGFESLDEYLGGLQKQAFIVLGARPSAGKTALACNLLKGLAGNNHKSLFISLEMTSLQVSTRLIAEMAKTSFKVASYEQLPNSSTQARISNAMQQMKRWPIQIYDPPTQTISQVCSKIREAGRQGVEVVIIDYIGLIRAETKEQRGSRYLLITECSAKLKAAARAANVAVVCLCQLRRESEKSDKPKMSDLRESGQLEQDADAIILIHRPERDNHLEHEDAQLILSKNRNGPTGAIDIIFTRQTMTFSEGTVQ
tara:strand:- start:186 stop:1505 length:1320 start_codon:yes stop_codon:yes gene_type:complete